MTLGDLTQLTRTTGVGTLTKEGLTACRSSTAPSPNVPAGGVMTRNRPLGRQTLPSVRPSRSWYLPGLKPFRAVHQGLTETDAIALLGQVNLRYARGGRCPTTSWSVRWSARSRRPERWYAPGSTVTATIGVAARPALPVIDLRPGREHPPCFHVPRFSILTSTGRDGTMTSSYVPEAPPGGTEGRAARAAWFSSSSPPSSETLRVSSVVRARWSSWLWSASRPRGMSWSTIFPGVGKTSMAKAIAKSINGQMSRIQFTPDLLPSDVTGTQMCLISALRSSASIPDPSSPTSSWVTRSTGRRRRPSRPCSR